MVVALVTVSSRHHTIERPSAIGYAAPMAVADALTKPRREPVRPKISVWSVWRVPISGAVVIALGSTAMVLWTSVTPLMVLRTLGFFSIGWFLSAAATIWVRRRKLRG